MNIALKLCAVLSGRETYSEALSVINSAARNTVFPGFAIVVDEENTLIGVLTDGDCRRAIIKGIGPGDNISAFINFDAFVIIRQGPYIRPTTLLGDEQVQEIPRTLPIPVLNSDRQVIDVVDHEAAWDLVGGPSVAIYGLGFVGITLAAAAASVGVKTKGIDVKSELVETLRNGSSHVFEPGLEELLKSSQKTGMLTFTSDGACPEASYHIIAVGTPLTTEGAVDTAALTVVVEQVGKVLKRYDHVMLRSTVPLGTTRKFVIPLLEGVSGFKAGEDFFISFTPERTVEGNAISEIRELPQIVGGYTKSCVRQAEDFWRRISPSVVCLQSLEAAELVKLANNSFRDLSFAFSNNLAMLCETVNVDANKLIAAANSGYPRNKIPMASPGVGGYCLTKDPYLFEESFPADWPFRINTVARGINEYCATYPAEKFQQRFLGEISGTICLVIGIAFKGSPETNDIRGSCAIDLKHALTLKGARVFGWDAVLTEDEVRRAGFEYMDIMDFRFPVSAVFVMNNHVKNKSVEELIVKARPSFVFDGWSQLDRRLIESVEGITYSNMGSSTEK